jgi:hypothetical protein
MALEALANAITQTGRDYFNVKMDERARAQALEDEARRRGLQVADRQEARAYDEARSSRDAERALANQLASFNAQTRAKKIQDLMDYGYPADQAAQLVDSGQAGSIIRDASLKQKLKEQDTLATAADERSLKSYMSGAQSTIKTAEALEKRADDLVTARAALPQYQAVTEQIRALQREAGAQDLGALTLEDVAVQKAQRIVAKYNADMSAAKTPQQKDAIAQALIDQANIGIGGISLDPSDAPVKNVAEALGKIQAVNPKWAARAVGTDDVKLVQMNQANAMKRAQSDSRFDIAQLRELFQQSNSLTGVLIRAGMNPSQPFESQEVVKDYNARRSTLPPEIQARLPEFTIIEPSAVENVGAGTEPGPSGLKLAGHGNEPVVSIAPPAAAAAPVTAQATTAPSSAMSDGYFKAPSAPAAAPARPYLDRAVLAPSQEQVDFATDRARSARAAVPPFWDSSQLGDQNKARLIDSLGALTRPFTSTFVGSSNTSMVVSPEDIRARAAKFPPGAARDALEAEADAAELKLRREFGRRMEAPTVAPDSASSSYFRGPQV